MRSPLADSNRAILPPRFLTYKHLRTLSRLLLTVDGQCETEIVECDLSLLEHVFGVAVDAGAGCIVITQCGRCDLDVGLECYSLDDMVGGVSSHRGVFEGGVLMDVLGTATMGLGLRFQFEWEARRNGSTCFLIP